MMDDLVKRLQQFVSPCPVCGGTGTVYAPTSGPDPEDLAMCSHCNGRAATHPQIATEAAAEIERLKVVLDDHYDSAWDKIALLTKSLGEMTKERDDLRKDVERLAESARQTEDEFCQQKILKALTAERDDLRKEVEALRGDASHTPEYWQGHDAAVAGVAMRWTQALTAPIPAPGVMNEPLESLYRRTEALRADANLALDLLAVMFEAYEDGVACYEEPDDAGGYIGNAFILPPDTFNKCANFLNRTRPKLDAAMNGKGAA